MSSFLIIKGGQVKKIVLAVMTILMSSQVLAIPQQLSVVGLIPDVSTEADVEQSNYGFGKYINEIGGYQMFCIPSYIDAKLARLYCNFGKSSINTSSNEIIYGTLKQGFTKKFGVPKVANDKVRNGYGTEFNLQSIVWNDQKGNRLTVYNRLSKVDEGVLLLESASQLKAEKEVSKLIDASRKF